jgi:hypothetical protein
MFIDFERPVGSLFRQPVNTFLGSIFLTACALWAGMFMWNLSTGNNPISQAIASTIQSEVNLLP